jgi:glycolate oxidase subunit GlcD
MSLETAVKFFRSTVGDKNVLTDPDSLKTYGSDWTKFPSNAGLVVLPGSTAEVAAVLKYCNDNRIAVVPSGGRTGLAAGAVAQNGEVVLSLSRMNKIHEIDIVGKSIHLDAGVILQVAQEKAKEAGLFFALDLASKGSCQIGGNIATNAGGLKLIRYGGMREQVLGLEVVLADGRILDLDHNLIKNNSGYDLKHLFISSEGTLGIITKARLRLVNPIKDLGLALFQTDRFQNVPDIITQCSQHGVKLTAFEFFSDKAVNVVLRQFKHLTFPFGQRSAYYILMEWENVGPFDVEDFLGSLAEVGKITDAVMASSSAEFTNLWSFRENISEAISSKKFVKKNDVSVPINKLSPFVAALENAAQDSKDIEIILFGHIGDGNVHINYVSDSAIAKEEFLKQTSKIEEEILDLLKKFQGSISAEHGIGLLKKDGLKHLVPELNLELMRQIKAVFDPKGILNPGKIF